MKFGKLIKSYDPFNYYFVTTIVLKMIHAWVEGKKSNKTNRNVP